MCNQPGHNKRKCPELGRGPAAQDAPQTATEDAAQATTEDVAQAQQPDAQPEEETAEVQPEPIQIVLPQCANEPSQRKKLPVKRPSCKKKSCPQLGKSASNLVSSSMTYDLASSTMIQILQDQAIATQQSQTTLPAPLRESHFIATCRDALPPPRVQTTATLGLKRRKKVTKTKENKAPTKANK